MNKNKPSNKNLANDNKSKSKILDEPEKNITKKDSKVSNPEVVEENIPNSSSVNKKDTEINEKIDEDKAKEIDISKIKEEIISEYNLNIEKEKKKQEQKVMDVEKLIDTTGFKASYQLIIAEIISKKIEAAEMYSYMIKRLKELGKEYQDYV